MYLHVIFAVKNRSAVLHESWRDEVFKYMAGIINQRGNYSLTVNGIHDHLHLFFDYKGNEIVSDLEREVKKASNRFIKEKKFCRIALDERQKVTPNKVEGRESGTGKTLVWQHVTHRQVRRLVGRFQSNIPYG